MDAKRRNSKKKSQAIELPESVLAQYARTENLLRHSLARKWLRYEFEYDTVENGFFNENKSKTFASILTEKFPSLKSRSLTTVEWRKIRKLLFGMQKTRRFSWKFVEQQRIDLEKYRRCYNVLQESHRDDQLVKLNAGPLEGSFAVCDARAGSEIYRLIVETKKQFAWKGEIVTELRGINNGKTEGRTVNDNETQANAIKAVVKLRDYNNQITKNLNKLLHFQIVKDALLFDALNKKKLCLTLSPVYFHRNCELRIHDDYRDFRLDRFINSLDVEQTLFLMLELYLTYFQYEMLAIQAKDYTKKLLKEYSKSLGSSNMRTADFDYFNYEVKPLILSIAKKIKTQSLSPF